MSDETKLQFGHGGEAVESRWNESMVGHDRVCFNSATAVKPWKVEARSFGRGEASGLQFGHGGEAVERTNQLSIVAFWPSSLQFGHGGEAVESWRAGALERSSSSFNSATAVKPWKAETSSDRG